MRILPQATALASALILALAVHDARAVELVGSPVKIASGPLNTVQAVVTPDAGGGFAAFSMRNDDSDVFYDKLFARFYGANGKPLGAAFRFDGKIKKKTPVGVFLNGGVLLGGGAILVPYIANLTETGQPRYFAQLFDAAQKSGGRKTIRKTVANPYPPIELRDGKALISWDPAGGGYQEYGFASPDGAIGKSARSFNSNYVFPTPIEGGFLTTFVSGLDAVTLNARVYDADGKPVREFPLLSASSSSALPPNRIVGLSSGDIALIVCERDPVTERCPITGQRYSRKGLKLGKKVTLVEDAPRQVLNATYLPDGGLFASFIEDDGGAARLIHRTFNAKLEPRGLAAEVRPSGSFSGGLTTLTDGRVAARYTVNGEETNIYVQIIAP